MAFDAGAITASLEVRLDQFDRDMSRAEQRVRGLTEGKHEIKIGVGFDQAAAAQMRRMLADLDSQVTRDATQRMRSGNGSLLATLMGITTTRHIPGQPTGQQAARQGLLGQIARDAGRSGGGGRGWLGQFAWGALGGGPGSQGLLRGLTAGIGPGILGISARNAGIGTLGAAGLGAIPSLAGIGGAAGIAGIGLGFLGAGFKGVTAQTQPLNQAYQQLQQARAAATTPAQQAAVAAKQASLNQQVAQLSPAMRSIYTTTNQISAQWQAFTKSLAPAFSQGFAQVPGLIRSLFPLFRAATAFMAPLISGLRSVAADVVPGLVQAFRAAAPLLGPLLSGLGQLIKGLLPGLVTLLKAAMPAVHVFAQILGSVGRALGSMFAAFAPVIRPASQLLRALFSIITPLLPIIGQLAAIMARALAPSFSQFAKVIVGLEPVLVLIGKVLASFAQAVFQDLVAAFSALGTLVKAIEPGLRVLFRVLANVFKVLENSGFFAVLGNALEQLAGPLGRLVSALLTGLAPILGVVIKLISSLAGTAITVLAGVLGGLIKALIPVVNILLRGLAPILPPIERAFAQVAGAIGKALLQAIKALLPPLTQTILSLLRVVVALLPILPPVIRLTALLIELALKAITPLFPLIARLLHWFANIQTWIADLIVAIIRFATNWRHSWDDIKQWAADAWHFLTHGWDSILKPALRVIGDVTSFLRDRWHSIWSDITGVAKDFWHYIWNDFGQKISNFFIHTMPGWFGTAAKAVGNAWDAVKKAVSAPVRFVIDTIIDKGLIGAFDWISSKVGGPHINPVHPGGLARGGLIKGGQPGRDSVLGVLMPGEVVVPVEHVQAGAVDHLRGRLPGFARGGQVPGFNNPRPSKQRGTNSTGSFLGNLFHSIWGKITDIGKITAAIFSGNTTALVNAITDMVGVRAGGAVGDMAKLLLAIPRKLIGSVARFFTGTFGGLGSGSNIVKYAEQYIGRPYVWGGDTPAGGFDCSGLVEWVYRHFGFHPPRTSQQQWLWARHVPRPVVGGLAFGAGADGTQNSPGHVGIVVSPTRMLDAYGTGFGVRFNSIFSDMGAVSGFGVPPGGLRGPGGFGGGPGGGRPSANAALARSMMPGWASGLMWADWNALAMRESGWSQFASNPSSGAYGIPQALPFTKMPRAAWPASAGGSSNPRAQIGWMIDYIRGRYRNPVGAWSHETAFNWYDGGGWLRPGANLSFNQTRRREAVLTPAQSEAFVAVGEAARRFSRGGGQQGTGHLMRDVYLTLPEGSTVAEALREITFQLTVAQQRGLAGIMPL